MEGFGEPLGPNGFPKGARVSVVALTFRLPMRYFLDERVCAELRTCARAGMRDEAR